MGADDNISLAIDDDDDDLQIVEESIKTRPAANRPPPPIDDDDDDALEIVEEHIVPRRSPSTPNDDIAVVEEVSATASHVQETRSAACAACATALAPNDAIVTFGRCRHALCAYCALRSVADEVVLPPPPAPMAGGMSTRRASAAAATAAAQAAAAAKAKYAAGMLRAEPMCVTPRCRAPLADADVQAALAPAEVDACFQAAYDEFARWADNDDDQPHCGPAHIVLPDFDPATDELCVDDDAFNDDTAEAYGFLWLYDKSHAPLNGAPGAWMCAACGAYERNPAPHADGIIPDHPLRPHCARARAYAVRECVTRLSKIAEEGDKPNGKPRKSTRSKRARSSKASGAASKRRRTSAAGFAKGTGYAGKTGAEWKGASSKMLENTRRVDQLTAHWLARLRCYLIWQRDAVEAWPGYMRTLLRATKLPEHLARVLINESIMDVGERVPMYVAALRVVAVLNDLPSLRVLVAESGENGRSLASLIDSLSKQAAFLSNGTAQNQTVLTEETKLLIKQIRKAVRGVHRHKLLGDQPNSGRFDIALASEPVQEAPPEDDAMDTVDGGDAEEKKDAAVSEERKSKYCSAMKKLQFQTVPNLAKASAFRSEADNPGASVVGRGANMRRVVSEVSSLFSSLPLSWSSTIVVRVDEDRYDFLRACVFGPEDTPYECGAFLFDIFLPPNYPESPPKFKLLTTGGGRVRFNPNLYANGKVCLSLLGTWTGPSWTAASTLLQVLVSIQSLIFVPEPFFNEPGFERWMGTDKGKKNSDSYNAGVRQGTVRWAILENLKNPFNEFRSVIETHFRFKRTAVERIMRDWFKEDKDNPNANGANVAGSMVMNAANAAAAVAAAASALPSFPPGVAGPSSAPAAAFMFTPGGTNIQLQMHGVPPPTGAQGGAADMASAVGAFQNAMGTLMAAGIPVLEGQAKLPKIEKVVEDVKKELDKLERPGGAHLAGASADAGVAEVRQRPGGVVQEEEPIALV